MYILRLMIIGMSMLLASASIADTGYISEHFAQFTTRADNHMPVDEITKLERQQQPIQKRLMVEEADGCETELRYFSEKLKENPDDAYYQFMMKKLGNRCLGE